MSEHESDRWERIDVQVSPDLAVVLSVRLPKQLAAALHEEAGRRRLPMSDLIREILEERYGGTRTVNSTTIRVLSVTGGELA